MKQTSFTLQPCVLYVILLAHCFESGLNRHQRKTRRHRMEDEKRKQLEIEQTWQRGYHDGLNYNTNGIYDTNEPNYKHGWRSGFSKWCGLTDGLTGYQRRELHLRRTGLFAPQEIGSILEDKTSECIYDQHFWKSFYDERERNEILVKGWGIEDGRRKENKGLQHHLTRNTQLTNDTVKNIMDEKEMFTRIYYAAYDSAF